MKIGNLNQLPLNKSGKINKIECDEGIKFVKPEYDNHCYGLIQRVSKLESNREAIWHEFSDV